ncbi:MAG: sigma-70 family RNA polymerase sigma factor [Crocinitomicaceae bacterium]|nr:sigma-70 family RNA polymerase sigma factor [Crocinitomicaceae bacterium]
MIARDVIEAFIDGKKDGFDRVYEAYSPGMFIISLRYTRCKDDAEDVLQEAFIKIFNNRDKYDIERPIGAWIKTITIRTALNYIKEHYKFDLKDDESYFDKAIQLDSQENPQQDLKNKLIAVLNRLPDGYRTIFNLYTIDNLTHKEIASYLGVSEGTSKSQYSKAKKMIKQLLQTERVAS